MHIRLNLFKAILVVVVLTAGISISDAEDRVAGHWEGHIEIPGQPLTVKVDLAINDSDWSGTIDIPAQGAKGLPLSEIHVEENDAELRVKFSIRGVPGIRPLRGSCKTVSSVAHSVKVLIATFDFRLSREAIPGPARPQEPKPPFPYQIEEVAFQNGPRQPRWHLDSASGRWTFSPR